MIEIQPLPFPSAKFPSADLRVNSNTEYSFQCAVCSKSCSLSFGWLLGAEPQKVDDNTSDLSPSIHEYLEANSHLQLGGYVNIISCQSCDTVYVVQTKIEETSYGAYRIGILGVAKVS